MTVLAISMCRCRLCHLTSLA